jgi:nitroreductase
VTATTLTETDVIELVRAAVRAPSIHNTQPWLFRLRDGGIELLADRTRRLPVTDPTGWAMRISCGAALFNLRLALAMRETPAQVRLRPSPGDADLLARIAPGPPRPANPEEELLYAAIPERRSSREPFWPDPVPAAVRARLVAAARAEGAWLELLIGKEPVAALAEIAQAADRVLNRIPGYLDELSAWTRRNGANDGDGVPAAAGGPSPEPQDLLPQRPFGAPRAPGRDYESEPLVAVLGTAGDAPVDQLVAGQALQRVLLTATNSGLATSMLSQPIEVASAREQLRLALGRFGAPQMVLRIGFGQPGSPTPRRDPRDVILP